MIIHDKIAMSSTSRYFSLVKLNTASCFYKSKLKILFNHLVIYLRQRYSRCAVIISLSFESFELYKQDWVKCLENWFLLANSLIQIKTQDTFASRSSINQKRVQLLRSNDINLLWEFYIIQLKLGKVRSESEFTSRFISIN